MKGKAVRVVMLTLLLAGMLTLAFDIQLVEAGVSPYSPAGGIKLSPSSINYLIDSYCYYNNTKFNVTVVITDITGCEGLQFWIYYNSTLLALDSWTFDTDPANPLSPTQMAPAPSDRFDSDASLPGIVRLATIWKAATPPYTYSGDSVAAVLIFKIIYCPLASPGGGAKTVSTPLTFDRTQTRAFDHNGDDILFTTFNDGYYEYTTTDPFGSHILAVYSSPSGVAFTVNGVPHTTPWSDWLPYGIEVTVVMPATHNEYLWNRWIQDGDTNRTVTVPMYVHYDLTALYTPRPVVGGIYIPTNKLELLAPYIGLTILLAVAAVTAFYLTKRRNKVTFNIP